MKLFWSSSEEIKTKASSKAPDDTPPFSYLALDGSYSGQETNPCLIFRFQTPTGSSHLSARCAKKFSNPPLQQQLRGQLRGHPYPKLLVTSNHNLLPTLFFLPYPTFRATRQGIPLPFLPPPPQRNRKMSSAVIASTVMAALSAPMIMNLVDRSLGWSGQELNTMSTFSATSSIRSRASSNPSPNADPLLVPFSSPSVYLSVGFAFAASYLSWSVQALQGTGAAAPRGFSEIWEGDLKQSIPPLLDVMLESKMGHAAMYNLGAGFSLIMFYSFASLIGMKPTNGDKNNAASLVTSYLTFKFLLTSQHSKASLEGEAGESRDKKFDMVIYTVFFAALTTCKVWTILLKEHIAGLQGSGDDPFRPR